MNLLRACGAFVHRNRPARHSSCHGKDDIRRAACTSAHSRASPLIREPIAERKLPRRSLISESSASTFRNRRAPALGRAATFRALILNRSPNFSPVPCLAISVRTEWASHSEHKPRINSFVGELYLPQRFLGFRDELGALEKAILFNCGVRPFLSLFPAAPNVSPSVPALRSGEVDVWMFARIISPTAEWKDHERAHMTRRPRAQ